MTITSGDRYVKRKPTLVKMSTYFENGHELGQIDGELEEIEEELELVEKDDWDEVNDIVFLIVDSIGDGVLGFSVAIQCHQSFHIHICFEAAGAAAAL